MRLAGGRSSTRVAVLALFLLALALRAGHLASVASGSLFEHHEIFTESDMYMFDQWSRRIVAGDLLGRETFHPLTGWQLSLAPAETWQRWYGNAPTFNKAPFYAYLVGLMRGLFGEPMLPLSLVQVLASAACVPLLFLLARRLFGRGAGLLAALLLALYGPAVHFSVLMLREVFIGLSVLLATWRLVRLRDRPGVRRALLAGLSAGLALIVSEALVSMLALALVWIVWRLRGKGAPAGRLAAAYATGALIAFVPVAVRNLAVGAPVFSLAVMGSAAAAVFDTASSNPYFFEIRAASILPVLEQADGRMGATLLACWRTFEGGLPEAALLFLRKSSGLLIPYENPDNVNYYYAALRDPLLGWLPGYAWLLPLSVVGLGACLVWRRDLAPMLPAALSMIAGMLFMLPLSRYRASFALLLLPLAGFALARLFACVRRRRYRAATLLASAALLVALAASAVQSRVVFAGRPAGPFLYRAPEFLLASQFHERHGDIDAALREAIDLARLNPTPGARVGALLRAAQLEAGRARPRAAAGWLQAAGDTAASAPPLLLAVADAHLSLLGDRAAARLVLQRAAGLARSPELRQAVEARLRALEPRMAP